MSVSAKDYERLSKQAGDYTICGNYLEPWLDRIVSSALTSKHGAESDWEKKREAAHEELTTLDEILLSHIRQHACKAAGLYYSDSDNFEGQELTSELEQAAKYMRLREPVNRLLLEDPSSNLAPPRDWIKQAALESIVANAISEKGKDYWRQSGNPYWREPRDWRMVRLFVTTIIFFAASHYLFDVLHSYV